MKLEIDQKTLSRTVGNAAAMRDLKMVARAHVSALKSTAYQVRDQLRRFIEYGGQGWPELHPLTKELRKTKRGWVPREWKETPLYWLGRFARYFVAQDGTEAAVGFGKSRKARPNRVPKPGSFDPALDELVRKHEAGRNVPVTNKVRRMWGASKKYSLRKDTATIRVPKRQSITAVEAMVQPKIPKWFAQRFEKAMRRYITGVNNKGKSGRTKLL